MKRIKKVIVMLVIFILITSTICMASTKTNEDFETALDSFMEKKLIEHNVSGVTISVVKDGKLYFKKGYGVKDQDTKEKIDSDETLFEIGSVTKLFTATAIMQLYEDGKLDLDDEVNKYLKDFKIKYYNNKPIRIKHLLTHTAGFDDKLLNLFMNNNLYEITDLEKYLKKDLPKLIREPGKVFQYSNHGMALLGLIVENVSNQKIDKYISENIFKKLGMNNTYYHINQDIADKISKAYSGTGENIHEIDQIKVTIHPAGSILSNANDMSKFLMAQFTEDLLKKDTLNMMHKTQFSTNEGILGWGYGFGNFKIGNMRVVGHDGGTAGFATNFSFDTKSKFGVFTSMNNPNHKLSSELSEFIYAQFFNIDKDVKSGVKHGNNIEEKIKDIEGNYYGIRVPINSPLKILSELSGDIKVTKEDENTVSIKIGQEQILHKRIGGNLFESNEGSTVFFNKDNENRVYMRINHEAATFEKMSKLEWCISKVKYIAVILSIVIFIISIVCMILKRKADSRSNDNKIRKISMVNNVLIIAILVISLLLLTKLSKLILELGVEIVSIKVASYLFVISTLLLVYGNIKAWKYKQCSVFERVVYLVQNISSAFMVISLYFTRFL